MSVGFPFSQVCDVTYRTSPSASKELKIKRPKDKSLSPLVHDCRPIEKCTKNGLVVFKERLMELERKRAKPKKAEQCSSAEIVTSEFSSSYNLTPKRNRSTATHRVPIDDSPSESNDQIDVKVTPSKSSGVLVISSSPDTFDNTPVSTSPDSWDEKLKHIVLIRDPKSPMTDDQRRYKLHNINGSATTKRPEKTDCHVSQSSSSWPDSIDDDSDELFKAIPLDNLNDEPTNKFGITHFSQPAISQICDNEFANDSIDADLLQVDLSALNNSMNRSGTKIIRHKSMPANGNSKRHITSNKRKIEGTDESTASKNSRNSTLTREQMETIKRNKKMALALRAKKSS